jgi:RNA polymerase sigma factor (sigma-70 family)
MPPKLESVTDEILMSQLCSATDPDTADRLFNEVFNRYHARVLAWCRRLSKNGEDASDLAQEIFLKIYRRRGSFRGDSRLSTWLYAITRNHCLTAMKKRGNDSVPLDPVIHTRLRDTSTVQPDLAAERHELCLRMLLLMSRTLEPLEAQVLALHYGHEVPLAIITRQLRLENPSGAKAYIVNARRQLHGMLRRRGWNVVMAAPRSLKDSWPSELAA